ncbi:Ras-like protein family member 12 RAS-like protein Ris [Larimichthys crocea]|uniref:small monomeric GTPase n=1 Tax=Larimichthys crocea TaxID=215358 RepID=A0A6G0IZG0_LARCR|nr:ras-like protein family member 12 [Larimichthys crocea]KAE8296909.1 Ras-like protein family member 12 RAS-like protein Ris [Larimichthys crocea]
MSQMFGKVKTCNSAAAPYRSPSDCNLVLLGVMGSGKSALTVKFLTKRFISEYDPHLEDIFSSEEIVDQQPVTVRVMDTCDKEGPVNSERYLSWANGFLVVYSIDKRESFEGCQLYLQTLALHNKTFKPHTPILLLGNKLDLDRYRQVSRCDAEALATRFGCLFFEVSACLDFLSVQHVFYEAVRRVRRRGGGGRLVPAVYFSEDKALLSVPSFTTPCYRELPAPATAKLVTVKTSRAQSKRSAATFTLLKGFKIF